MIAEPVDHAAQYLTFNVGGRCFGIAADEIQEVLREQPITRVPLAPPAVEGLINLRGQIVPAIDMRRLLAYAGEQGESSLPSVVVRTEHGPVSLQVDQIGEVMALSGSQCEPPPRNLNPDLLTFVKGIFKLEQRILLVLDAARITR